MVGEVFFGALRADGGREYLPGGHFEVGDETLGAMAFIVELAPFDLTGTGRDRDLESFQGLNTRHLIGAHQVDALLMKGAGFFV